MREWGWTRRAVVALTVAAALGGCDGGDSTTPIEVSFGDRDGDGIRDGHLTPRQAERMSDDDLLIVSIGDSIAAGEGNPDREARGVPGRERWTLRRCHRSLRSGHAEAALAAERADDETGVGFVPLACSGATVAKGLLGRYRGIQPRRFELDEPPQLDRVNELAAKREIDALVLSVGANDVYFSRIAVFCLAVRECWRKPFDPDAPFPYRRLGGGGADGAGTLAAVVGARLAKLPRDYDAVQAKLSEPPPADRVPPDRVVIVEYFDPTTGPGPRGPRHCSWTPEIAGVRGGEVDPAEFEWAQRNVLRPLNSTVRQAARRHGWRVVGGVDARFAGHGICAGGARWVGDLDDSLFVLGLNHHGTLHPNRAGHQATGELIAPVLSDVLAGRPGG